MNNKLTKPNHLTPSNHNTIVTLAVIILSLSIGTVLGCVIMFSAVKANAAAAADMKYVSYEYDYSNLLEESEEVKIIEEKPTKNERLLADSKWLCNVTDCGYTRLFTTKMGGKVWKQYDFVKDKWFRTSNPHDSAPSEVWEMTYTGVGDMKKTYKIFTEPFFCDQWKWYLQDQYSREYAGFSECTKAKYSRNY